MVIGLLGIFHIFSGLAGFEGQKNCLFQP